MTQYVFLTDGEELVVKHGKGPAYPAAIDKLRSDIDSLKNSLRISREQDQRNARVIGQLQDENDYLKKLSMPLPTKPVEFYAVGIEIFRLRDGRLTRFAYATSAGGTETAPQIVARLNGVTK